MSVPKSIAPTGISASKSTEVLGLVDRLIRMEQAQHRDRLKEIKKVATIVGRIASDSATLHEVSSKSITKERLIHLPLEFVKASVKKIGTQQFTLDDLCLSLETEFPDLVLSRATLSRRLYELRKGKNPTVDTVRCPKIETELICRSTRKQRVYRYIGPP